MKKILILFVAAGLFACGGDQLNENEKTVLLTAVSWKVVDKGEIILEKFSPDGTYVTKYGASPMESVGKWEWISENEISMQQTGLLMNGKLEKLDVKPNDKYILKIASLSATELIGTNRHLLDSEDSGFVRNVSLTAVQ